MQLLPEWQYIAAHYFPLPDRPGLFNPYGNSHVDLDRPDGHRIRQHNLYRYLAGFTERPRVLVVASCARARACRFSGIPMVSESQLMEKTLPFSGEKSSAGRMPWPDVQASLFWDVARSYHPRFFLWNATPFFPHGSDAPLEQRPLSSPDVEDYFDLFLGLLRLLNPQQIIALGPEAEKALQVIRVPAKQIVPPGAQQQHRFREAFHAVFEPAQTIQAPPASCSSGDDREAILSYLAGQSWQTVYWHDIAPRQGRVFSAEGMDLSAPSRRLLAPLPGLYRHQKEAIAAHMHNCHVCLATSTASGKTLAFHVSAVERLTREPNATVLAVYPLKALAAEQEERWRQALHQAGLKTQVGRIDGSVRNPHTRYALLRDCRVILMTPDVIHAWLLGHCRREEVVTFLGRLRLIVLDEAHTYTGVFGSNSAYLFRRLNALVDRLGVRPCYLAASATIHDPAAHLRKLTGRAYRVIGSEMESSPRRALTVLMVEPPEESNPLHTLSDLMGFVAARTGHRFITFVDSRKKTEYLASMASRRNPWREEEFDTLFSNLPRATRICPYRAGYEERDRKRIQQQLSKGALRGVISTSALEAGIDIPHLTLGILHGVPDSATSFWQRIGRIGRHNDGLILIINDRSVHSQAIFSRPDRLLQMPLTESALYLENERIQYIHALCYGRPGGEADLLEEQLGNLSRQPGLTETKHFPDSFALLCRQDRMGQVSPHLQEMRTRAGESPGYAFPLRDIDIQFKIILKEEKRRKSLGSISHGQAMREAYPGAVYYYAGRAYRVIRVNLEKRLITVRKERKYITTPTLLPGLLRPVLPAHPHAVTYGVCRLLEVELRIREVVNGYRESRGNQHRQVSYPIAGPDGIRYGEEIFARSFLTSGVLLFHPALQSEAVRPQTLSDLLLEALFQIKGFHRSDIAAATGKLGEALGDHPHGTRYLAFHDLSFGGLHLTRTVMERDTLQDTIKEAATIAANDHRYRLTDATEKALLAMEASFHENGDAEASPLCLTANMSGHV